MENTIDELMRRDATEFKGPKDPDLQKIIQYIRQNRAMETGKKAKRSEVGDEADPELWKIIAEARKIHKKPTFRRF
jgi:hypothetical protein